MSVNMASALHFIDNEPMTFHSATNSDRNIINLWAYDRAIEQLYKDIFRQKDTIAALIKHHLRLHNESVSILPPGEWIRGGFNVCVPIQVTSGQVCKKFILRCPMPHKLAEARYPGTIDEKTGCEVGAYAWMQENCPSIRIPHLYGFGFSDHRHFTHERQRPWYIRFTHMFRRYFLNLLRYPGLSRYTANPTRYRFSSAYMLLEYIGPDVGQMLSRTWERHRNDPSHKRRLFRSMSRIILSLARLPQPRIGSFEFHDNCTITLTNRPLSASMMILESEGTPRLMRRNETYHCTDSYVADVLTLHDAYFLSNPNAAYDKEDCRTQMAARTLLRAISHQHIKREQRNGPFFLQFTDLHRSNIFVDEDWNITCLLDLEWICALPIEMMSVPYWISGSRLDGLTGEALDGFNKAREEFMKIFEQEENRIKPKHGLSFTRIMKASWTSNRVWFWEIIGSVNGLYHIVDDHICGRFSVRLLDIQGPLSMLWRDDAAMVVENKMADYQRYVNELGSLYKAKSTPPP